MKKVLALSLLSMACHGVTTQPVATSESSSPTMAANGKVGTDPGHATQTGAKLVPTGNDKLAAFAAGCFWGVEDAFRHVQGVVATAPGYSGGHTESPTYEDVCTHTTGHAETVLVEYDPAKVSYEKLLQAFWMMHDPTQVNRQGPDYGDNYRSVVFTFDDEQARVAKASKEKEQPRHDKPIATSIEPMRVFYKAEPFHQQYSERTGDHSCPINLKLESL